jgi:tetratricopeptide (TPR) repeat protein
MLKTRSRRSRAGEDEKEAAATEREGPDEQQWAWVRKQVIECYKQAGKPEQAVAVFRQAIKADPQDLEMRMQLVAALEANEQEQAAYNELKRIAELDPYHLEAQIKLVNLESEKWNWPSAKERLRTLAGHYRDKAESRTKLAGLFMKTGQLEQEYGLYDQALATYEEGLALDPANYEFPLNMARTEIDRSKPARARERLVQSLALATGNPYAYGEIIDCWAVLGKIKEARAVLDQAEASLTLEPEFYIVLGMQLLKRSPGIPVLNPFSELANLAGSSRKKAAPAPPVPPETEWSALARECLQKAEALRPADPAIKTQIRNTLLLVRPDMALPYAEELVRLQPDDPNSQMMLGIALDMLKKEQESKKALQEAARLARRKGDTKMARQIEEIGRELRNPIFRLMGGIRGLLANMGMDDDEEFEDDDFDFF